MRYRSGARTTGGRADAGNAAPNRYAAAAAAAAPARKKSRRQVLDELYGLHNPDEWSEQYLEFLLGDLLTALGLYSYHTHRSDKSDEGYVDETIIGGREVLFAELKTATGKLSPAQIDVVHRLNAGGALVRIYRPADWISGRMADDVRAIANGPGRPPAPWPHGAYRCGCERVLVHTEGHSPACPIERTVRKTPAGNPGRPWWHEKGR